MNLIILITDNVDGGEVHLLCTDPAGSLINDGEMCTVGVFGNPQSTPNAKDSRWVKNDSGS